MPQFAELDALAAASAAAFAHVAAGLAAWADHAGAVAEQAAMPAVLASVAVDVAAVLERSALQPDEQSAYWDFHTTARQAEGVVTRRAILCALGKIGDDAAVLGDTSATVPEAAGDALREAS